MRAARKITGMLASATLLCAGNLCINASKVHGAIPYVSVTVTFLIEVLKLVVVGLAIVVLRVPPPTTLSPRECAFYAVPSLLYMIDNNLTYVILRYIDPATLSVLWNLKIITTAVLFRVVLRRRLSEIRKIAIVLLLLGVVTSQSDHLQKERDHHSRSANANATATATTTVTSSDNGPQEFMFATLLLLTAVTLSSCASVFTEWAFKRKSESSFLWQNVQLYVFGILFNGLGLLYEASEIRSRGGFFAGYSAWTVAVILVHCTAGISVGLILKFLDNIACVYAHAVAMMLTMLFSMLFFHFSPSLEFVCGLSVLVISMYLYHHKLEPAAPSHRRLHGRDGTESDETSDSDTDGCGHASTATSSCSSSSSSAAVTAKSTIGLHAIHKGRKKHYEQLPGGHHVQDDDSDDDLEAPAGAAATTAAAASDGVMGKSAHR